MLVGFFFLRFVLKRTVENLFMIQLSRCYVKKKNDIYPKSKITT